MKNLMITLIAMIGLVFISCDVSLTSPDESIRDSSVTIIPIDNNVDIEYSITPITHRVSQLNVTAYSTLDDLSCTIIGTSGYFIEETTLRLVSHENNTYNFAVEYLTNSIFDKIHTVYVKNQNGVVDQRNIKL